jgi:hypothetical protein
MTQKTLIFIEIKELYLISHALSLSSIECGSRGYDMSMGFQGMEYCRYASKERPNKYHSWKVQS